MNIMKPARDKGFTIVELIVVIIIISVLATIAVFGYNGAQERATQAAFLKSVETYEQMLRSYRAQNGHYPPTQTYTGNVHDQGTMLTNVGDPIGGRVCLGNPSSSLQATDKFPVNACWAQNSSTPLIVANDTINNALKTQNKLLPNAPAGTRPIGGTQVIQVGETVSMGALYTRALLYSSKRGSDGLSFHTSITFYNFGEQSCGHAKKFGTAYADGKPVTACELKFD